MSHKMNCNNWTKKPLIELISKPIWFVPERSAVQTIYIPKMLIKRFKERDLHMIFINVGKANGKILWEIIQYFPEKSHVCKR